MDTLIVDFEKGINNVYPILLNENINIGNVTINQYETKKVFVVFFIDIPNSEHRCKGYFPKTIEFLENYGKNKGFKYLIGEWITQEYISFYLKRGFRELTKEEYDYFPIRKESGQGKEICVIKELS